MENLDFVITGYVLIYYFSFLCIYLLDLISIFFCHFNENGPKLKISEMSFFIFSILILIFLSALLLLKVFFKVKIILSIFIIFFYSFVCAYTFTELHYLLFLIVLIVYGFSLFTYMLYNVLIFRDTSDSEIAIFSTKWRSPKICFFNE